jgi:hypothetical protein
VNGRRAVRVAVTLWVILAVVVWNVTFDRVIVEAGRAYIRAARESAKSGSYLKVGDWMSAAIVHGVWLASGVAVAILAVGLAAIRAASKRDRANQNENS